MNDRQLASNNERLAMMKSWLFSVVVLFVVAKALLWVRGFILPLPVYVLAGAFLAIASNYDKGMRYFWQSEARESNQNQNNSVISQTASLEEVGILTESNQSFEI
jgi:hypothetical protein